jgi:hypothetical protein
MNRSPRLRCFAALALSAVAPAFSGCDAVYPADAPPGRVIFPMNVALVPSETAGDPAPFLLVANSDFDLRYRQGTLQSLVLDRVAAAVDACTTRPCVDTNVVDYLADEVQIGPHVGGMAVSPRGDRVYLAIRSESDVTWVDIQQSTGALFCGAEEETEAGAIEECTAVRRTTPIADDCGDRAPTLSGDIVGIVSGSIEALTGNVSDRGLDWVMLTHRNGRASLMVDVLQGTDRVPTLVHSLTGLPPDATNAALDPTRNTVWMTTTLPGLGSVPIRTGTRDIAVVGVSYDRTQPTCSTAFSAGRIAMRGLDDNFDSRDVAFSADGRYAHVLSRRPLAVVTVDIEGTPLTGADALIRDVIAVPTGAARLDIATVDGTELVAATSFDRRMLSIIDGDNRELEATVHGFTGPQDVVIDGERGLAYVVDFLDSVIRVIDLRPLAVGGSVEIALQIGTVTSVRGL